MRVLIVGCGYVGLPLGAELVRLGHEVHGLRRNPDATEAMKAVGLIPHLGDITQAEALAQLPGPFDWVVNTVASGHGGEDDYRRVYFEGTQNLINGLAGTPIKKFVYTSSTGVYGQTDGSLVKEDAPTTPSTPTSQWLVKTEDLLRTAARDRNFPAVILRVAGIYGPDRGHYFQQYLRNEARIPGKGERLMNMIHRDDVVTAIIAALKSGRAGETYNAVDDEPVAQIHFFRWLSETLGKWMPPFVAEDPAEALRKRGLTHKKVSNRRMKMELGVQLRYPNFRQGYTAEITRLERAGELNIEAEPR